MFQEDVFFGDVAEDEGDLGLVGRVAEDGAAELVHGRDAGAAGYEADVVVLVGRPGVFGDGAFEVEALRRVHAVEVFGHGPVGVAFDDEVEVAASVFVADGRVGSDDRFVHLGAFVFGEERRGDLQTRDVVFVGQGEAELLGVVVDLLDAFELQVHPALVAALEGLVRGLAVIRRGGTVVGAAFRFRQLFFILGSKFLDVLWRRCHVSEDGEDGKGRAECVKAKFPRLGPSTSWLAVGGIATNAL